MPSPVIEKVLILQDRDAKRLSLGAQLRAVPGEVAEVEERIAAERAAIDEAKSELRHLESEKKLLETEIGTVEDRLNKYRTQQLAVKKNDEYQALGHEIETMEGKVGELEGRELELMYAIDEAGKRFKAAEKTLQDNIAGHEARIALLGERKANLDGELDRVQVEVATTREPLSEPLLRLYDRIAARQMPVCVPLAGGKCAGCHLKVSSEVESATRGKIEEGQLPACDQCGRLVYWDS